MHRKPTSDDCLNAALIREQIGHSLRNYYQARMTDELPPRLLSLLKKLGEDIELSGERINETTA